MQILKCKTKLKNQNFKMFLNFDLGFDLCILRFALFYYALQIIDFYFELLVISLHCLSLYFDFLFFYT